MSNQIIPLVCCGLVLVVAPLLQQPKSALSGTSKGVVNTEFVVVIDDIVQSKSGITSCKMTIPSISKQMIGPCETTSGTKLEVGTSYTVSKANISDGFISINKAVSLGNPVKWEVIETYVKARTPLMKVRNGDIEKVVGNEQGLSVGQFISLN